MTTLLDLRAQRSGITFHRTKRYTPFVLATAGRGPMMDILFAMTRPVVKKHKKTISQIVKEAPQPSGPVNLPKGMVPYRREHWGEHHHN